MNTSNWMSNISSTLLISQFTIPGTHDSATYNVSGSTGFGFVQTQSLSISEQLAAGCRFLDIRCRLYEDHLVLHHGAYYLDLNFNDVINFCTSFLTANPTETILMSLKDEYDSDDNTITYEQAVKNYVNQNPAIWYTQGTLPTLQTVRGKIVLLRRFKLDSGSQSYGIDINLGDNKSDSRQIYSNPNQYLYYEDLYNPDSVDDKEAAILKNIGLAQAATNPNDFFLTFTSAYKKMPIYTPEGMADVINPWLMTTVPIQNKNMGTFAIDYVNQQLAEFLIASNFPVDSGYIILCANGGIHTFGTAKYEGHGVGSDDDACGIAATPSKQGYWIVSENGGIHCYGDAGYYGHGVGSDNDAVAICATKTGKGYWILCENGGIHTYGDAVYYGHGVGDDDDATAMAITPSGAGYWLLSPNGGIHCYGDAGYYGHGVGNDDDAIGIASSRTGAGYTIVSENGGIHTFGDAGYYGHGAGDDDAVAIVATATGEGYWLLNSDGGIYAYGDAQNFGQGKGSDNSAVALTR